jgi:hypothetical protein
MQVREQVLVHGRPIFFFFFFFYQLVQDIHSLVETTAVARYTVGDCKQKCSCCFILLFFRDRRPTWLHASNIYSSFFETCTQDWKDNANAITADDEGGSIISKATGLRHSCHILAASKPCVGHRIKNLNLPSSSVLIPLSHVPPPTSSDSITPGFRPRGLLFEQQAHDSHLWVHDFYSNLL